jgi:translocation and assembly module TamB
MRGTRRLGAGLAWTLVALGSLLASAAYHAQTATAREVAIELVTSLLDREIAGRLTIGAIDEASLERVVARDVRVFDPRGREVIHVERLVARPDWGAIRRGVIRVDSAAARRGSVHLFVGQDPGTVSLAEAFTPARSGGARSEPPRVIVDGITLDGVSVEGDVPGFSGLRVESLHVEGRVEFERSLRFSVWDAHGTMTAPYRGRTTIDAVTGFFDTDLAGAGLDFYARAHRGGDRVRARIRLRRPRPDRPPAMELRATAEPLRLATLTEMGVAPGLDAVIATVRGRAALRGSVDALSLSGELASEAGFVRVTGSLPTEGPFRVEAVTRRLELERLVEGAPALTLAGRAAIELARPQTPTGADTPAEHAPMERRAELTLEPTSVAGIAVPALTMRGRLEDEALVITTLDASPSRGRAHASGRVGYDGSLDLRVEVELGDIADDPNVHAAAPDASGALTAALAVRAEPHAADLEAEGTLTLRGFRYGPLRAQRLTARGRAGGALPTPQLALSLEAAGLQLGGVPLGETSLAIRGGAEGYAVEASAVEPSERRRLEARGRVSLADETWRFDSSELALELAGERWAGVADVRVRPGREIVLMPVRIARGASSAELAGTYRFAGEDKLGLELSQFDLASLGPWLGVGVERDGLERDGLERDGLGRDGLGRDGLGRDGLGLGGALTGSVSLDGDLEARPQLRAALRLVGGQLRGLRGVSATLDASLTGEALSLRMSSDLGDGGALALEGQARVDSVVWSAPTRWLDATGLGGLTLRAGNVDASRLAAALGLGGPRFGARVTTEAAFDGTLLRPEVSRSVTVLDALELEGWPPMRGKLRASLVRDRVLVEEAWLADATGELARAHADLPLPLRALPRDLTGAWQLLRERGGSADLRLVERRIDTWPSFVSSRAPRGVLASAQISARSEGGELSARYEADARWDEPAVDAPCATALRPRARVRGEVVGEEASAAISLWLGAEEPALTGTAIAVLPLEEWARRGDVSDVPSTELVARVRDADLAQIPWLCGYGSGPLAGSITAKNLLTGASVVGVQVDLPALRVWQTSGDRGASRLSEAYRLHVQAGSTEERDAIEGCAILGIDGEPGAGGGDCSAMAEPAIGELLARVRVPVRWREGSLPPEYSRRAAITASAQLRDAHVAPVLTLVPGVVTGDALMNGVVSAEGPWPDLRLDGSVALSEGQVELEGLGQHLHDVEGRVELNGDELVFPTERPLFVRDTGGTATVSGRVGLEGLVPTQVDLSLRASDFPIRREGMVLAWLSGDASVQGDVGPEETRSTVRIRPQNVGDSRGTRPFAVRLPDASAGSLQPLGSHPDVLVVGDARPPAPGERESRYGIFVRIDATDRFWIERSDFTAEVTADLRALYRDPNLYVGGEATIRRGTFEIFGKRFELQQSTMTFDPNRADLDPRLNIAAVYPIPGRTGATVTVSVRGTLSAPEIDFSSTETSERAEIIALLVSGGRRDPGGAERQVTEQAASFLAGLTAGILTLGLREELGSAIPVRLFAIESEALGVTRLRVGFDANELIPEFMRGVVLDAYIEGFVTASAGLIGSSAGMSAGAVGGGVTLEFTLPEGFSLRGTYLPVENGSLDLLFEPR